MTVVGIVGVLSVVAYTGYHKFVTRSQLSEATNVLAGIKMQQERYKAETGSYLNISPSLAANTASTAVTAYPHCTIGMTPGAQKLQWGGGTSAPACPTSCCNSGTNWTKLRVETNAPTYYGYSTIAGAKGGTPTGVTIGGATPNWGTPVGPWFVATALGDPDGNSIFSTEMISSFDNEVYVDNEGE